MGRYKDLCDNIDEYYSGTDKWTELDALELAPEDYYDNVSKSTMYHVKKNLNGDVTAYTLDNVTTPSREAIQQLDSNSDSGDFLCTEIAVQNSIVTPQNREVRAAGSVVASSAALKTGLSFYYSEVLPALAAAAAGIGTGKKIDQKLYDAFPDFWDTHGMQGMDPETWNDITGGDNTGINYYFNAIFGLDPNKHSRMYIDENAWAYLTKYLSTKNVYSNSDSSVSQEIFESLPYHEYITQPVLFRGGGICTAVVDSITTQVQYYDFGNLPWGIFKRASDNNYLIKVFTTEDARYKFGYFYEDGSDPPYERTETITVNDTILGEPYGAKTISVAGGWNLQTYPVNIISDSDDEWMSYSTPALAYIILYGTPSGGAPEGFDDQPGADIPVINPNWTVNDVKLYLRTKYPDVYDDRVTNNVVQPDGSTRTTVYVPVPYPVGGTEEEPTGGENNQPTQKNPDTDEDNGGDKQAGDTSKKRRTRPSGGDTDTGDGETPRNEGTPSVSGNKLFTLYEVTSSQLDALGAALWNSSIIEQIKQMFTEPMDAFISLKQSFIEPGSTSSKNIKLGYYDTGVGAKEVVGNLAYCNCGSVNVDEYFKNAFDYNNVKIRLYLPFVGFVPLDVDDVMRSTVGIKYTSDLFTGETMVEVNVLRDAKRNMLYTYNCNTSLDLPLTSGTYASIISGSLSMAGGVVAGFAAGGVAGGIIGGVSKAGTINAIHGDINRGGRLSGNGGAACIKKPFIVIERPQIALPDDYTDVLGFPALVKGSIRDTDGFVRVKEIDLKTSATAEEQREIEQLLREGVYVI